MVNSRKCYEILFRNKCEIATDRGFNVVSCFYFICPAFYFYSFFSLHEEMYFLHIFLNIYILKYCAVCVNIKKKLLAKWWMIYDFIVRFFFLLKIYKFGSYDETISHHILLLFSERAVNSSRGKGKRSGDWSNINFYLSIRPPVLPRDELWINPRVINTGVRIAVASCKVTYCFIRTGRGSADERRGKLKHGGNVLHCVP